MRGTLSSLMAHVNCCSVNIKIVNLLTAQQISSQFGLVGGGTPTVRHAQHADRYDTPGGG